MIKKNKIFVTGGSGFIGSNFIGEILDLKEAEILNYDKLTYSGNPDNLKRFEENKSYSFFKGDICDKKALSTAIFSFMPDYIIHFAAESHVDRSIDSPSMFIKTNIVGSMNMLSTSLEYYNKIKDKKFKFLHISTDEVFGSLGKSGFFNEETNYNPKSPYSASKASSDHLVRSWNHTYGLPTIITNCSNNYGPYQFPEKLIPLIIANCFDEKDLPIYGDGLNIRDWLYVSDHCSALRETLFNGLPGETYCIGGNNELTNIEIVKKICNIFDRKKPRKDNKSYKDLIKFVEDRPGHDYRYAIDSAKIAKTLNWKPEQTFETGIEKTVDWYIENEKWWRKIQNKNYKQERLGLKIN
tara:strand:+ start:25728 stop:26789 length:1062 start_codon:yes stop_codon:yes gene_type:complete